MCLRGYLCNFKVKYKNKYNYFFFLKKKKRINENKNWFDINIINYKKLQ